MRQLAHDATGHADAEDPDSVGRQQSSAGRHRLAPALAPRFVSRLSLRWRLTLATFGLLTVLFGALGLVITLTFEHTLLQDQAATMHTEARLALTRGFRGGLNGANPAGPAGSATNAQIVFSSPQPPPASGDMSPTLDSILPLVVGRLTFSNRGVSVWTPAGAQIAGADAQQLVQPAPLDRGMIQAALSRPVNDSSYLLTTDATGQRQLVVLLPIIENDHTVALLELNSPTTPIDNSVASTQLLLFLGIGGCLILGALLARPLLDAALRPLVAMERASRRIAGGALSLRLDEPPTADEIGRLARSFNSMVARLDAAFTRQRRFVADVSHELRTPLTALAGGIEMQLLGADRQDDDPEASRRLLRGLYAETERMRRLVEDLLTLARLDEGRMELRMAPVDVGALVGEVCEQGRHLTRGQRIVCDLAPNLPAIQADADRLRQVLLNLVENAVKFTPATGQITLSARPSADGDAPRHLQTVQIEVRDSGAGIPPEDLPHVFDRFYRVDSARTRGPAQAGGSGLGLAIAKSLLEAQSGSIAISSQPGEGTAVVLRLPALGAGRTRPTVARPALGRTRIRQAGIASGHTPEEEASAPPRAQEATGDDA